MINTDKPILIIKMSDVKTRVLLMEKANEIKNNVVNIIT